MVTSYCHMNLVKYKTIKSKLVGVKQLTLRFSTGVPGLPSIGASLYLIDRPQC